MHANGMVRLAGAVAIAGATLMSAPVTAAEPNYYFCWANDQMGGTVWQTALRPAGPDLLALGNAWLEYVKANLFADAVRGGAQCPFSSHDAMATHRATLPKKYAAKRVVDVDWSFWKDAETPEAAAKLNQAAAAGQWLFCWSDASQSPLYLSGDIHIDVPMKPDPHATQSDGGASDRAVGAVKDEFLAYLKSERGYRNTSAYPASCVSGQSTADLADRRKLLHQRFPQLQFVETGWTPGATPSSAASSQPAKTPTAPAAAAQSAAPSAYEKALEAQRPRSNAPATPPPADDGRQYSYCWDIGHPPHPNPKEPWRTNFYVSGIFPADPARHPGPDFEKTLRAAHPQERIDAATCTAPQPMAATKAARDNDMAVRQKSPYITVSQVDWTP